MGVTTRSFLLLLAWAASVAPAAAEVSSRDQSCITGFNKTLWSVARIHSRTVGQCLRDFAAGTLVTTAEDCLRADPKGKLATARVRALQKLADQCASSPPFGFTGIEPGLVTAAVSQIDLAHGALGADLDATLIPSTADATCQSRVAATLMKCHDTRLKAFLKCQKKGMRDGQIVDATSLSATCLGVGAASQPDQNGKIATECQAKLAATVTRYCSATDVTEAFPLCGTTQIATLVGCLTSEPSCQLCRMLNTADGLARQCDVFDDGDDSNGSCGPECGDGVVQSEEPCDDGDASDGDGCSSLCRIEAGFTCTGSPSVCTPSCGNGALDPGEGCDDGDAEGGDGCSAACQVEAHHTCVGEPSICVPNCGNGVLQAADGEACDDGDGTSGDGCSAACQIEPGFLCAGQPSVCAFVCGNGTFQAGETCDDGDAAGGDGCSPACRIEPGWLCSGQPSHCTPLCGDGRLRGGETCDDRNAISGDGCSFQCQAEVGYACVSEPSNCIPICGDGFRRGLETCDDGNADGGDGCSASFCRQEIGFSCLGQPSVCAPNCGNGDLDPDEACDDGDLDEDDGCDADCQGEAGWSCGGEPSVCVQSCGNGALEGAESCDDGNATSRDGCSASCRIESGWYCGAPGLACQPFEIFIDGPPHGSFTTAGMAVVSGHYTTLPPGVAAITVNGTPASTVDPFTRTFSHTVALNGPAVLNPVRARLTNTANGNAIDDRIVVIAGPSVADGALSPESVALRMNDTGIDAIEPLVSDLAAGLFDLGELVPPGTVILPWQCYFQFIWCWAGAEARIGSPAPSFGAVHFGADAKTDAVAANIVLDNLRIDIDIDGTGLAPDCGLRLTAQHLNLNGDYTLGPDPVDPSQIDVNLAALTSVTFDGFQRQFTYGNCGLVEGQLGNVEDLAQDAITGFIDDPDGPGPLDSPLADAVESALSGVSLAGAVGSGLGLELAAPLFDVSEDPAGITLGADASFTVSVGPDPGQCIPPPGAPNLAASYAPVEAFPTFGPTTPVGGVPYGVGVSISTAGLNQLLRGQTECGLLRTSLTTIDLDGEGGVPPVGITAGLLALLVPEFAQLPPATPLRIDVAPTIAPLVTGNAGPAGEPVELKIGQVAVAIVEPSGPTWLAGAFDARLGADLGFTPTGLGVLLHEPAEADTTMAVLYNPLGADVAQLEDLLPSVIRPLIPELAGGLGSFPLPEFFGLSLQGVEVARSGQFVTLFADLAPQP